MEISHGIVKPHCGAKTAIFGRKTVAARVKVPPARPWAPYVKARHAAGANRLISEPDASQASPGLHGSDFSGGVPKKAAPDLEDATRARVNFFMNNFRKMGLIDYNGDLEIHSSLLDVILHDEPGVTGSA